MKQALMGIIFIVVVAGGVFLSRSFYSNAPKPRMDEFFMEGRMHRIEELEVAPEIKSAMAQMKSVNLCGLIYNTRVSQTTIYAKLGYPCDLKKWINIGMELSGEPNPPFSPFGVKKFGLLPRGDEIILVAEGTEGENTFEELATGIPKVILEAIRIFPDALAKHKNQEVEMTLQNQKSKDRQEEIKKSFSK